MSSAVLVIDVQAGYFDEEPRPFEADEVIEKINALTDHARAMGVPVIFVQHEQPDSPSPYGSEGWKLQAGLVVDDFDIKVRKTTPDSFLGTKLEEILRTVGADNLVVCGFATEFCVDTTVRRAAALGYSVQLASDAHTTHEKAHLPAAQIREHHNNTLSNISSFGVKISAVPSGQVEL